jgi:hypothetical protein
MQKVVVKKTFFGKVRDRSRIRIANADSDPNQGGSEYCYEGRDPNGTGTATHPFLFICGHYSSSVNNVVSKLRALS